MKRFWLSLPRWLRIALRGTLILTTVILVAGLGVYVYLNPSVNRTDGIVYGTRHGRDLTMDVIQPKNPNGIGIALMVSGGWKSGEPGETPVWLMAPVLRRGYTVFAICHISQPDSTVMEIIQDMHRGVRFVRHHAAEHGIDPDRIGVSGGSAGGHLSLMLATRGGPGPAESKDPVDRESSSVQAAAIFYPVTDLLNLGDSTENPGDGGPPISYVEAFGPDCTDMAKWKVIGRDSSPIYHVNESLPPILIHHGDADTLVPLEQSERFREEAAKLGHDVELKIHSGGGHGWLSMHYDVWKFAEWFDEVLLNSEAIPKSETTTTEGATEPTVPSETAQPAPQAAP